MDPETIARTILQQLKEGDIRRFYSWGCSNFVFDSDEEKGESYLQFQINGALFKGKVRIALVIARDTYRVEFYKGFELKDSFDDIHCEELAQTIDEYAEKPANVTTRAEYHQLLAEKKEPFIKFG